MALTLALTLTGGAALGQSAFGACRLAIEEVRTPSPQPGMTVGTHAGGLLDWCRVAVPNRAGFDAWVRGALAQGRYAPAPDLPDTYHSAGWREPVMQVRLLRQGARLAIDVRELDQES